MELAECFKEGYNTNNRYTSTNIIKDSLPINIHS